MTARTAPVRERLPSGHSVVRLRTLSFVVSRRTLTVGIALFALSVIGGITLLYVKTLPPGTVTDVLLGGGNTLQEHAILRGQLPIALMAIFAGAGLAASGALMQTVSRNPLATPDLLGISVGASLAAVLTIAFPHGWGSWFADRGLPLAAVIGATVTAAAMYLLSWKGRFDTMRLILIGVALTWLLTAATGYLLMRAEVYEAQLAQRWLVGSVSLATWSTLIPVMVVVPLGLIGALILARRLLTVSLGDDVARSLGVSSAATAAWAMTAAVVLAAVSVSGAGPIAFVALLAPQITLRITRAATPGPLTSALCGAALVLAAEMVSRALLPSGIPVGVVTAGIGGPFLIFLLIARPRKAS